MCRKPKGASARRSFLGNKSSIAVPALFSALCQLSNRAWSDKATLTRMKGFRGYAEVSRVERTQLSRPTLNLIVFWISETISQQNEKTIHDGRKTPQLLHQSRASIWPRSCDSSLWRDHVFVYVGPTTTALSFGCFEKNNANNGEKAHWKIRW